MSRWIFTSILYLFGFVATYAQIPEGQFLTKGVEVPINITNARVAVVVDSKTEDWKSFSEKVHNNFKKMGIDAMLYLNYKDFHGGQSVEKKTVERLRDRKVSLIFFLTENGNQVSLQITPLGKELLIDMGAASWYASGPRLGDVLVSLGVKMKARDLTFGNYLIPDEPEYLDNLKIYRGAHYKTYPSRLKSAPLAVALIPRWVPNEGVSLNPSIDNAIVEYNNGIDNQNEQIKKGFDGYPYKVEFFEDKRDELFYNDRFQFVLRFYRATGETVKKGLGYSMDDSETNYISMIPTPDGKRSMKTISRDRYVYKFYIKQTVAGDVHVGRYYDAEEDFETALSNFVKHMIVQFQR